MKHEYEAKFLGADVPGLQARLAGLGATTPQPGSAASTSSARAKPDGTFILLPAHNPALHLNRIGDWHGG